MRQNIVISVLFFTSIELNLVNAANLQSALLLDDKQLTELINTHCKDSKFSSGQRLVQLITGGTSKSSAELSCARITRLEVKQKKNDQSYLLEKTQDVIYREKDLAESSLNNRLLVIEEIAAQTNTVRLNAETIETKSVKRIKQLDSLTGFQNISPE